MHFYTGLFVLLLTAVPSLLVPLPEKKNEGVGIIDPGYTNIKTHSYSVAILTGMDLLGGGVLIKQNWVLTAASVVHGFNEENITVRVGSNNSYYGGHPRNVSRIVIHPQYSTNQSYDLAVVKLDHPVLYRVASHIAYLARVPFRDDMSYGNLTGYGQKTYDAKVTDNSGLEILDMELYSTSYCNNKFWSMSVPDIQFCALANYSGPCFGDIGDPLAKCVRPFQCELLGIYTGDNICDVDTPSTYMDVGQFYDWIAKTASLS
uniref:Peptidase S1 domain-containing protein n=1 Tax=Graphocephala atropunctata TaxID=36148 RepID=A0A1B6L6I6_9HEMI